MTDIVSTALRNITTDPSLTNALKSTGHTSWGETAALMGPGDAANNEAKALAEAKRLAYQLAEDGSPIPEDIAAPVLAARRQDDEAKIRHGIIVSVLDGARSRSEHITESDVAPALAYLRQELASVIKRTKALAEVVGSVRTAEAAMAADADVSTAFRELVAVHVSYMDIRAAQRQVMDRISGWTDTDSRFERVGLYADSIDIHPHWVGQRSFAERSMIIENGAATEYRQWLKRAAAVPATQHLDGYRDMAAQDNQPKPEQLTGVAALLAIVRTTRPWIPTPHQYRRAMELSTTVTGAHLTSTGLTLAIEARAKLYALGGISNQYTNPSSHVTDAASSAEPDDLATTFYRQDTA